MLEGRRAPGLWYRCRLPQRCSVEVCSPAEVEDAVTRVNSVLLSDHWVSFWDHRDRDQRVVVVVEKADQAALQ